MPLPGSQYALFESVEPIPVETSPQERDGDRRFSDNVVLHENEIHKQKGDFVVLAHQPVRQEFMRQLSAIMAASNFILIACVVDKTRLTKADGSSHPYHIAFDLCLSALDAFIAEKNQSRLTTHLIVECRGKREDAELELEFRRIRDQRRAQGQAQAFELLFADKRTNLSGLQLADLVARPIGVHHLRPQQANQAFDILRSKFYCRGGRQAVGREYENVGLLQHPPQKAKSPGEPTEAIAPTRNPQST